MNLLFNLKLEDAKDELEQLKVREKLMEDAKREVKRVSGV